jgi:hypothetical protein
MFSPYALMGPLSVERALVVVGIAVRIADKGTISMGTGWRPRSALRLSRRLVAMVARRPPTCALE